MSGINTERVLLTYLGQHVAVVSYTPLTWPVLDRATIYPDGHIPGEKYIVESDRQLCGEQAVVFGGPKLANVAVCSDTNE